MPRPYRGNAGWSADALFHRPVLAAHVGQVIALWASVETQATLIISAILHSDAAVGYAFISAIRSESIRLAAIEELAKERLSTEDYASFTELQRRIKNGTGQRDRIAHAIWGVPNELPNSIVHYDPRIWVRYAAISKSHSAGNAKTEKFDQAWEELTTCGLEYTEQDFTVIEANFKALILDLWTYYDKLTKQSLAPPDPKSPETAAPE